MPNGLFGDTTPQHQKLVLMSCSNCVAAVVTTIMDQWLLVRMGENGFRMGYIGVTCCLYTLVIVGLSLECRGLAAELLSLPKSQLKSL